MVQFIENEELAIGNEDKDSRRKLSQTSGASDACFVNPLMRRVKENLLHFLDFAI
jgi:hypothetical protein